MRKKRWSMLQIVVICAIGSFLSGCTLPHAFLWRCAETSANRDGCDLGDATEAGVTADGAFADASDVPVDNVSFVEVILPTDSGMEDIPTDQLIEPSDVVVDVPAPDVFVDAGTDVQIDVPPDVRPDVPAPMDVAQDVPDMRDVADVQPDVLPDVRPDVPQDVQPDVPPLATYPVVVEFQHRHPMYPMDVPAFANYWWRVTYTMPDMRLEDWRSSRCTGGIVMISATTSRCTLDVSVPDGTTVSFYPVYGGDVPVCPSGMPCPSGFVERFTLFYGARMYSGPATLAVQGEAMPVRRQYLTRRLP